jgi:soluble lytic murein transglycosylase-like protein
MTTDEHHVVALHATQRLMLRGLGLLVFLAAVGGALSLLPPGAEATRDTGLYTGIVGDLGELRAALNAEQSEAELQRLRAERAEAILRLSKSHPVSVELAEIIYDEALRAGIEPGLAFEIVRIESRFDPRAVSAVGAIGLAQVMPRTAVLFDSTLTRDDLFEPATNLRIGFRFFRDLLERYDYDLRLALLAYNRGPTRVGNIMARGEDPGNGYDSRVLLNYGAPKGPTPH